MPHSTPQKLDLDQSSRLQGPDRNPVGSVSRRSRADAEIDRPNYKDTAAGEADDVITQHGATGGTLGSIEKVFRRWIPRQQRPDRLSRGRRSTRYRQQIVARGGLILIEIAGIEPPTRLSR
jgi:hypothetical protein